jgi:hypothetical protein
LFLVELTIASLGTPFATVSYGATFVFIEPKDSIPTTVPTRSKQNEADARIFRAVNVCSRQSSARADQNRDHGDASHPNCPNIKALHMDFCFCFCFTDEKVLKSKVMMDIEIVIARNAKK